MLKALKEIRRLVALALSDIIDAQECWNAGVAEIEDFDSIQVKLQAILRNVDEALEEKVKCTD